jgi:hypothetical protein
MRRPTLPCLLGLWAALVLPLAGCKSGEERCREAQAAAQAGWSAYHAELKGLHDKAVAEQAEAHTKISGPIEQRLSEAAKKLADQRYDRDSSAWLRAYDASLQASCADDPECFGLKQLSAAAKLRSTDLAPRLLSVQAAIDAASDTRVAAQTAAAAVTDDFERAEPLKAARQASQAADEACDGVK